MADNDYLGNIQQQRLNQQWSNNMAWATPSWMQGDFKQGNRVSQTRYQAPNAGVSQSWRGGEILDTRTKPGATAEAVDRIGQGFVSRNLNRQAQAQQAQQKQQAGQNFATQYQALASKAQYQAAFSQGPSAPTSVNLTSGVGKINQNLARWNYPAPATDITKGIGLVNRNIAAWQTPATSAPTSRATSRGKGWK
jgi:hypothetical protein